MPLDLLGIEREGIHHRVELLQPGPQGVVAPDHWPGSLEEGSAFGESLDLATPVAVQLRLDEAVAKLRDRGQVALREQSRIGKFGRATRADEGQYEASDQPAPTAAR
jgi:hypothetical protein